MLAFCKLGRKDTGPSFLGICYHVWVTFLHHSCKLIIVDPAILHTFEKFSRS